MNIQEVPPTLDELRNKLMDLMDYGSPEQRADAMSLLPGLAAVVAIDAREREFFDYLKDGMNQFLLNLREGDNAKTWLSSYPLASPEEAEERMRQLVEEVTMLYMLYSRIPLPKA